MNFLLFIGAVMPLKKTLGLRIGEEAPLPFASNHLMEASFFTHFGNVNTIII